MNPGTPPSPAEAGGFAPGQKVGQGLEPARGNWRSPGFDQSPTHPVCGVSADDALAFCNWLTEKERTEGKLTAEQSYRLPQDWEWSVAVGLSESREGAPQDKSDAVADIYPWRKKWPPPAGAGNYAGEEVRVGEYPANFPVIEGYRDGYARTSPVGRFASNRFGLYDMGGNLWQWCEYVADDGQKSRVLRGGSWFNADPRTFLSSHRDSSPADRTYVIGFRCVLVGQKVR